MTSKKATQSVTALVPITKDNLNALTSPQFKTNVNKMFKAEMAMNKDMWLYAAAVHNIVINKYYEKDCKTEQGFSERMGVSKGTISKCVTSVNFIINVLGKYGFDMNNMSYTKAYLLSTLKEDIDEFINNYCKCDLTSINMRDLEEKVKAFKEMKKGAIDSKSSKEENSSNEETKEPTEEEREQELPTFTGRYDDNEVWFTIGKKKYVIPMRDLKHYIKK